MNSEKTTNGSANSYPVKMNDKMQWRGYPLRCWPNHQDDCYRWDWEILIDGTWLEVVTQATRWIEEEADEVLVRYLRSKTNDPLT
jgi:hypothetical protein